MARRVELDLLESDGTMSHQAAEAAGAAVQAPEARVSLRFRFRNLLQNALFRLRRPDVSFDWRILLSWKVLVPAGTALVLAVAVAGMTLHVRSQERARVAAEMKKQPQQAAAVVAPAREAVFSDFSIDLRDAEGRYRFLQCDITLEFQSPTELTGERKEEIRKIIYLSARKNGRELIRVADSGNRFKKAMRVDLHDLLGEDAIKDIYITRYLLL